MRSILGFKLDSPWTYFLFTIIFSWAFWGVLLLRSNKPSFTPYGPLFYIGGIAPFFSAVTLTYLAQGRTDVINLVKNTLSFTSLTVKGIFIILILSTASNILSVLIRNPPDTPFIAMDHELDFLRRQGNTDAYAKRLHAHYKVLTTDPNLPESMKPRAQEIWEKHR